MAETQERNDGELLAEFACSASEAAFVVLVERHSPMVHAVCLRVLGDFHEAQDVTQAVFLTLARKAVSLRKDPSIGGWLHRVALCLARDVRSSRQSRRLREERTAMDRETTTVETSEVDRHALRAELDEVFDQLPARYRQALVLFHLEERSLTKGALQTLLMTQLKTAAIIGIACTVVTATGALATRALLTPAPPATSVEQEIEKPASTTIVSQGARSDAGATHAQRIRIANETLIPRNERTMTVRFDISWNKSWRHEVNHDAAWVFFKVRPEGATEWQPVRLAAEYADFLNMQPESGDRTRGPDQAWQASTGPELSWAEGARWTAWAGLRPMTELEYEKTMRGFREPMPYEAGQSFWGYLVGKRVASVARVVSVADVVGRNFPGTHGLGTTILPADWPQADAVGTGIRGGGPDTEPALSYTSDRMRAALADDKRDPHCAWHGVRTEP